MNFSSITLAYLDPGTGATLMQLFLAGTAGIAAAAKLRFRRGKEVAMDQDGTVAERDLPEIEESDPSR